MNEMNENAATIRLRDFMDSHEGWGREQGRAVYQKLLQFVETHPGVMIFRVSLEGVRRVDISFASETVVEIARRFRGSKGFCFLDLNDADMLENWVAAAERKKQPLMVSQGGKCRAIGVEPGPGNLAAFRFALERPQTRSAEFAATLKGMSITNASTKFKQLQEQGFLLRHENTAESGGVEYVYYRIC